MFGAFIFIFGDVQCSNTILARTPDMPLEQFRQSALLVSRAVFIITITVTERYSLWFWNISRSDESWVWKPFALKFPVHLWASHSLSAAAEHLWSCSTLLRSVFYRHCILLVWDEKMPVVFTQGTGPYCARHCSRQWFCLLHAVPQ